ncbi:chromatin associated protein KTI12 [Metschnikowia bicuspidata var. bicuspidata NRRL YB-4993]|uniref:Chromatin associated protein KTI12 n=1 Tax=Metschnikowia bicuspidata var. bicuspidata NRRL YB-4993 TaxID=869754 RepID=A0A1A0GYW6_9ASCO|nr:chromatin associated protein KTI12 [Metschnikowia bicuspidata var. bicuspidata NRRL YB-4993]OBA16964.1 chromatin associated protein KTI12 [Metschnikowia bicuspidata var. bicuspidata NRRL YB-4993]
MPLVTFTGPPCSGKTRWARQLIEQLEQRIETARESLAPGHNYKIVYHSDETLGIDHLTYRESATEKHARGTQLSAVKRDLSRSTFVILDSLSYIKGFRYQLFCEAKGVVTPHCVIQVMTPMDKCLEWNEERSTGDSWDADVMRQLAMRYEEPNADSRWDSPLFTLVSDYEGELLPMDQIWEALVLKRPPPPNAATLVKPTSGNDYLQELDRRTLEVISKVVQHQQLTSTGGRVVVDFAEGLYVEIPGDVVSIAQLQRIRRTFVSLNRMRSIDVGRIASMFVEYVNKSLNE